MHSLILKLTVFFIVLIGLKDTQSISISDIILQMRRMPNSPTPVRPSDEESHLQLKYNPAPSGNRCGVCPTYFQKICAFSTKSNETRIFDNHCVMDLYNCLEEEVFAILTYDHCLYFGNFAYVHGLKKEDLDYGDAHYIVKSSKKNPDFV